MRSTAPNPIFAILDTKPDPELLDLAEALIEKKTAPFKPDSFHDRYVDALERLIEKKKKAKGRRIIEEEDTGPVKRSGNVIDLMAALKKSVDTGGKTAAPKTPAKKPAARRSASAKPPARKRA